MSCYTQFFGILSDLLYLLGLGIDWYQYSYIGLYPEFCIGTYIGYTIELYIYIGCIYIYILYTYIYIDIGMQFGIDNQNCDESGFMGQTTVSQ